MKFISFLINLVYWLWLFIIPTGIMGGIAYYKYYNNSKNILVPIIFLLIGISLGVFIAELVRRKYGLAYFFSRINASPDMDKLSQSDKENKNSPPTESEKKN